MNIPNAEVDQAGAFRTHHNYLRAWRHALEAEARTRLSLPQWERPTVEDSLRGTHHAVSQHDSLSRIQRVPPTRTMAALIGTAWTAEGMLLLTGRVIPSDGLPAALNWSVVQAYYAVFQATRALAAAFGTPSDKHESIQRYFGSFWVEASRGSLVPWALGFGSEGPVNGPERDSTHSVHPWSAVTNVSCWSIIDTCLRTTRADSVKDSLRDGARRKAAERKKAATSRSRAPKSRTSRLSADERLKIQRGVRPATLLDYLYRLRVRSNYHDTMMWAAGATSSGDCSEVQSSLEMITSATLLATELFIAQRVGPEWLEQEASRWLATAGGFQQAEGLRLRHAFAVE